MSTSSEHAYEVSARGGVGKILTVAHSLVIRLWSLVDPTRDAVVHQDGHQGLMRGTDKKTQREMQIRKERSL